MVYQNMCQKNNQALLYILESFFKSTYNLIVV